MQDATRGTKAGEMSRRKRSIGTYPESGHSGHTVLVDLALHNVRTGREKPIDFMATRHQYCELAFVEPRHTPFGEEGLRGGHQPARIAHRPSASRFAFDCQRPVSLRSVRRRSPQANAVPPRSICTDYGKDVRRS